MLPGLTDLAAARLDQLLADDAVPGRSGEGGGAHTGHRGLAAAVRAAVVVPLARGERPSPEVAAAAGRWLGRLEDLQTPTGLFGSGDNLQSPPDSSFTVNDVATIVALLRGPAREAWDPRLRERLETVLRRVLPALVAGGVHTPNHRWELASALAATGRLLADDAAIDRARDWLGEGIDVDADGLYSERSPNYASAVTGPSLLTLARELPDEGLAGIVHRNLHATLDLTNPDGRTESHYSRRQDQRALTFPLGPFLAPLARFAGTCERCARGARLALLTPHVDAVGVLALAALDDDVRSGLDRAAGVPLRLVPDHGERLFADARLWRRWRGEEWTVVDGGSDVPATGQIASGLAANPTFARLRRAGVEIASLRLSRTFFGLGPFRAETLTIEDAENARVGDVAGAGGLGDGTVDGARVLRLDETVRAGYYQPLAERERRADAVYALEHEGRFAAAMSFASREVDELELRTTIRIADAPDAVVLDIETEGTGAWHALEIALASPVVVSGAVALDGHHLRLVDRAWLRAPGSADGLEVVAEPAASTSLPAEYDPGERYTHLGGTDALGGLRLYAAWSSPGRQRLTFRVAAPTRDG
ncbi:MAG: hypothetical protein BGO96_02095 [Micrococcales bacterium 73-15]|uniref:hypothetical protein n=1 Tax=Salana multivorans TaxID=120377 RepID=UPI00095A80C1|nr:hypothetical protein [Salana multivorans]OJX96895.1 MAG: hypothetical protein BGO96_02095 [Micrococcales bacterium 73-15]